MYNTFGKKHLVQPGRDALTASPGPLQISQVQKSLPRGSVWNSAPLVLIPQVKRNR